MAQVTLDQYRYQGRELVRSVIDGLVVVVMPNEVIDRTLAERLGLVEPTRPPRPRGDARPPNLRKRGS